MGSLPKELLTPEDLRLDVRSSSSSGNEDDGEEEEEKEGKWRREEEYKRHKKKHHHHRVRGHRGSEHLLLQNKRRRSGFQSHLSLGDLVGDQKKFWASLQHTHDWSRRLHDHKDNELEWDYGDVQSHLNLSSSIWTFNDFMERYNQLYASLNQIQDLVFSSTATSAKTSSADSIILNEALANHLEGIREEYERFVKQSSLMAEEFTDLWDEVMCRVELLAAKWEILMARSSASKASVEEANPDHFHSDIEQDVRGLRKWLKEMEGKILPLRFRTKWSREAIEEKMKEIQVILNDIESHGRIVKSVLRLCEDLKKGEGEISPRNQHIAGSDRSKASYYDVDRAFRIAKGLEDRWHGVWLRSLEWHYFLEKLAWNSGEEETFGEAAFSKDSEEVKHCSAPASLLCPNSGFDSEDEPRCKVPKLLTGLQDLSSSPSSTLLRTKRRKTSEYARINNNQKEEAAHYPEEKDSEKLKAEEEKKEHDGELPHTEVNKEKSLEKTWNRVLEAAAALEENQVKSQEQRKTLKVNRKKSSGMSTMNGDNTLLDDNRSSSPNNNSTKITTTHHDVGNDYLSGQNKNLLESTAAASQAIGEDFCKMATSESEQSLNSISSGGNGDLSNGHNLKTAPKSNGLTATRKTIPNCATYFFQHVSEDEHASAAKSALCHKTPGCSSSPRGRISKRDPYDRSYPEDEEDSDDHYQLSDSTSTSDFLESNAWLKELEEDDEHSFTDFSDSNAMGSSTNTIVESASGTFLNEDIQELVHQAEKLVQTDQDKVKKRGAPLSFGNVNSNSRRRRSRKSLLLLHPVNALDGCEASAEATSTSESDFSDDDSAHGDGRCSSPGEMDTSLSSHDQTLTGSCSTNALDIVSINTSSMTLGSGAMSKLKKIRRKSSVLSASESHLVYSFKKSVSLNSSQKSRSVASIYGSSGSFGGVVKKRKGSGGVSKKFAIPCMSISSEEETMESKIPSSRRKSMEGTLGDASSELKKSDEGIMEKRAVSEAKSTEDSNSLKEESKKSPGSLQISPRSIESEEDFWDQENYLSEHNYDEAIDEDTAYRVLNFGDDYSVYINSMSDGISSNTQPPKQQRRKTRRNPQWRDDRKDSMSESEVEDVKRVLNTSKEKYEDTEAQFNIYLETQPENVLLEDYFNLKKTCEENMSCLALLMEPIFSESDSATLKKKGRELKGLLQKWDGLLRSIIRRIELTTVLHELEDGMLRLETSLKEVRESTCGNEKIFSAEDLRERISGYKESLVALSELKGNLFKAKVGVHNFLAGFVLSESRSSSSSYNASGLLKDEENSLGTPEGRLAERLQERVNVLYASWEDVFHITNARVVECENTLSKLQELEEESKKLRGSHKNVEGILYHRSSHHYHLSKDLEEDEDSGISGSSTETEIAQKERLLTRLRLLARELEATLSPESGILKEISDNLEVTSSELKSLGPRRQVNSEEDSLEEENGASNLSAKLMKRSSSGSNSSSYGRRWRSRVLRSAVPMQIGLFLMWFLSWAMEPTCCDSSNTFFLAPQLRYVNGPPPI